MHFASTNDTPLTEEQIARFRRFTELGDELDELYKQTVQIREDFVTHKSKQHRRLRRCRVMDHAPTQKLYKRLCRVVPWFERGGPPLWMVLQDAVCDCPLTGHIVQVMVDGQLITNTIKLVEERTDNPTEAPHLDECVEATEGDLAFIVAVAKRWQQLAADARGLKICRLAFYNDGASKKVAKAAKQLEEEAMVQLSMCMD